MNLSSVEERPISFLSVFMSVDESFPQEISALKSPGSHRRRHTIFEQKDCALVLSDQFIVVYQVNWVNLSVISSLTEPLICAIVLSLTNCSIVGLRVGRSGCRQTEMFLCVIHQGISFEK